MRDGMGDYQRYLTSNFEPFDPLELARQTEKIVTRQGDEELERKYVAFYSVPVYRGIATGYAVGCCLRCVYCWTNSSREYPEKLGTFYSPKEVAQQLFKAAENGVTYSQYWSSLKVNKLRLSGCEPTLGKQHLLSLLEYIEPSKYPLFILETNGILFGTDLDYVKKIAPFSKIYVRVSLKAATPGGFTQRTGAKGEFYELPFKALKNLLDEGIYARAAAMTDPRIMPQEERQLLKQKLAEIDPLLAKNLEEEVIDPYDSTKERLKAAGINIRF